MSRTVSINFLAFLLGLSIGVGVDSVATRPSRPFRDYTLVLGLVVTKIDDTSRITINSVPDWDFPEALKKRGPTYGNGIRLIAIFDADGSIKSVRPYPMVPFGVDESAAGSGEFARITPFQRKWRFADSLPYGLTELAIQQVSKIRFNPSTRNGRPYSQRVFVLTDFTYSESYFARGCSKIDVTITDDTGVIWSGNTWVNRNRGCAYI